MDDEVYANEFSIYKGDVEFKKSNDMVDTMIHEVENLYNFTSAMRTRLNYNRTLVNTNLGTLNFDNIAL